ncbi:molybdenum cofactor guanylyltransferase [Halobacillus mangrovi]|uniref:molybdenum cofactor guanylyltransferase n=1 Tax=Halobacillus mangrovi TaxID=402384 RepID=UPI003D95E271
MKLLSDYCAAVLAGGGSTRMGTDKARLPLGNSTVEERVIRELHNLTSTVVLNKKEPINTPLPTISDVYENVGPLGGLQAVMEVRKEEWFIVSACDTPFIKKDVYQYLTNFVNDQRQTIIPIYNGRFQPLSGLYHKSIYPELVSLLENGDRQVGKLLDRVHTYYVEDFGELRAKDLDLHFFNMNTPDDYQKAKEIAKNLA